MKRRAGEEVSGAPRVSTRTCGRSRTSVDTVVGRLRGEPERRPTEHGESEDRKVAVKSGNGLAAGPDGVKAVRVDTNFRREP